MSGTGYQPLYHGVEGAMPAAARPDLPCWNVPFPHQPDIDGMAAAHAVGMQLA